MAESNGTYISVDNMTSEKTEADPKFQKGGADADD